MSERERHPEQRPRPDGTPSGPDGEHLEEIRQAGHDLLAAGDQAIERALSGDSEAFLRANRQQGGE